MDEETYKKEQLKALNQLAIQIQNLSFEVSKIKHAVRLIAHKDDPPQGTPRYID